MKFRLLLLSIIPLLSGCAKYHADHLKRLKLKPVAEHKDILFAAKTLTYSECHQYLGRNVIAAGYIPIQLAICNNSENCLEFSVDKINLKTTPANFVAESVRFSVLARLFGYGIPGLLILWPLLIPAIVDPIWAAESNSQMLRDYLDKSLHDKDINPGSILEGLIFVAKNNYQNTLEVTLLGKNPKEKIICSSDLIFEPIAEKLKAKALRRQRR